MASGSEIAIIGAGPAGLGAAWALHLAGHKHYTIYEARSEAGGLASSEQRGGHWFDFGGHVLYVRNRPFADMLDALFADGELVPHRQRRVLDIAGARVDYPIETHCDGLPSPWRERIAADCTRLPEEPRTDNFLVYLFDRFGPALCDLMFLPFNRRMWRVPLNEMSCEWLAPMVPAAGAYPCRRLYPKRGGIGEVWRRLAERLGDHIEYGTPLAVDDVLKMSTPAISTMPLTAWSPNLARQLKSVDIWVQYRLAPWPHGDCERVFTIGPAHYTALGSPEDREAYTVEWNERFQMRCDRVECAYPVPTLDRESIVRPALAWLRGMNVYSVGRFGTWRYENAHMDRCFLAGYQAAREVLGG